MEIDTSETDWFFKISYLRIRPPEQRSPCHEGSRHKGYRKTFESGIKFLYVYPENQSNQILLVLTEKGKLEKRGKGGGEPREKIIGSFRVGK